MYFTHLFHPVVISPFTKLRVTQKFILHIMRIKHSRVVSTMVTVIQLVLKDYNGIRSKFH